MDTRDAHLKIRERKPLIHHMTNVVVTNLTANLTLAIGALPVMAYDKEEVEEIVDRADVLLLNIGTITREQLDSMLVASKRARADGKKIILDPVGCGASALRKEAADRIIAVGTDVVKGNFAEICTLVGKSAEMRGVESEEGKTEVAIEAAETLSERLSCTIAVTGREDVVSNGVGTSRVVGGNGMLKNITGSGCMATTAIACFLAVEEPFYAAMHGLELMKRCSEDLIYDGPASFQRAFLDRVFSFPDTRVRA